MHHELDSVNHVSQGINTTCKIRPCRGLQCTIHAHRNATYAVCGEGNTLLKPAATQISGAYLFGEENLKTRRYYFPFNASKSLEGEIRSSSCYQKSIMKSEVLQILTLLMLVLSVLRSEC